MRRLAIVLLTAFLTMVVSCAKHVPVPTFCYDKDINSVVIVKNQLGGHGTGFYIGDNLIVTAKHVVPETVSGFVMTEKGIELKTKELEFTAETYAKDCWKLTKVYDSDINDVSILKIEDGHNLTPVVLGEPPKIKDRLYMISHPATFQWSYSEGYVINIPVTMDTDKFAMLYNIARFFGSSGAAVFNEKGEVVGLINALLQDSSIAIGHTVKTIREDIGRYYRDN